MTTKTAQKFEKQVVRKNRELQFVRLGQMRISSMAQRKFNQQWADGLLANMDIDQIGTPEVSFRDGYYYITDGQHRIDALKRWLGQGWEDQSVQCWVATGLGEKDEAEIFLKLNNRKIVDSFNKFKVAVIAGHPAEIAIKGIVESEKLCVSQDTTPGAIGFVSTLMNVYKRNGGEPLRRSLRIARDAYGDPGLQASVIDGFGLLCHRYNGVLDERSSITSLSGAHGGVNGLLGMAEQLRQKTGNSKAHCVAAAAVIIVNRGRTGAKKLPDYWKN